MKKIKYYIACLALVMIVACKKDNYEGPNAKFYGQVIDLSTGKALETEQPNGFRIKFTEKSWGPAATAQYFYGMANGSFNWSDLFGYQGSKYDGSPYKVATYEVQPIEGAFMSPVAKNIEVNSGQQVIVNFEVIPFLHLEETHSVSGKVLTVNYKITRPDGSNMAEAIRDARILITDQTSFVGAANTGGFVTELSPMFNLSEADLDKMLSGQITLQSGKKYWMRVGARTANPQNRYNYTSVVEINVP